AMGVLRSALPVAAQAGAAPVSSVSQAAGPVPGADAPAPPVLAASAAGAPTPDTAAVTPNQIGATPVPQASVQGAVPAAAVTAPADPAAPAEPLPQITPASEPRANAQGEELPLAAPREAPKAALANLTFTSEAPKPVGQAPAMVQAITPMAQPSAATDAAAALSPEAPAAVASRASADLAPAFSFARNIAAQVRGTVFEEGKTRVELTPRGLGDIEVEVARDDSGKLRVVLRAENAAVLTAFRNDRDMILGMLRDGGVAVEDGEVAFESFGGHASYEDRGAPRSRDEIESVGASPLVSEEALMPIRPAAAHATSPSGALDITT
ncbi:MAG: flagellar hook-length control protein FliK, partial [Pseudomonadota bacterium]